MGRSLQNRFCSVDSAILRAEEMERKTGKPYFVKQDSLGYYYAAIDTFRLTHIRLIQALHRAEELRAKKQLRAKRHDDD